MKWTLLLSEVITHQLLLCNGIFMYSKWIQIWLPAAEDYYKRVGVFLIYHLFIKICFRVEFPFRQELLVMCQWGIPPDPLLWFPWVRWRLLLWHWEVGELLNALPLCLISLFPTHWHARTWMEIHPWINASTVPASTRTRKHTHTHTVKHAHTVCWSL